MKTSQWSLNRIYRDPQLKCIKNRINFIQNRSEKAYLPVQTLINCSTQMTTKDEISISKEKTLFKGKSVDRDLSLRYKAIENDMDQLRQLKSLRYKEMRETSEKFKMAIKANKDRELTLKKIKRKKVMLAKEKGRQKLQAFQQQRLNQIRKSITQKQIMNTQIQMKRIGLKRRLMEQQAKSLNKYQEAISYKSQLMVQIQQLLREGQK